MMIPDSKSRLEKVILELVGIMASSQLYSHCGHLWVVVLTNVASLYWQNELPEDVQVDASLLNEARELVAQHDVGQGAESSAIGDDDEEPL